ncbi:amidase domain-containing protein [Paenibacillus oenotherae]|uniref:Amidase domain-containing protein n=1 Tax=Paenibacillus oenotherae TaxID=1435645 RepID=A0ABS7D4M9_9BACL|nr:amidase domain-containing protein [Paenibacillus oenotherae]MBW7474889.1 amidase domain-containing protein [Paenibacillus oenotherae]
MPRTSNRSSRGGKRSAVSRSQGKPQEPVLQGWKAVVHEYVTLFNQAEIDRFPPVFTGLVKDGDHLSRCSQRLYRMKEQELLRGVLPTNSQTKAELLRVSESSSGTEIVATIGLHIKRTMDQSGRTYMEERCERERIWLNAEDGRYYIARIEPVVSERRPRFNASDLNSFPLHLSEEEAGDYRTGTPSIPYINYDILPVFNHQRAGARYRRDLAAAYADRWWEEPNPAYETFDVNCTNYVSQCLFAGHAPMNYTSRRDLGWWYRGRSGGREQWSYSWAVSNALQVYLSGARQKGLKATIVHSPEELELGDVITYDWGGDNRFQHSTIVTAFDAQGMPLVNANTVASRHRYWDYQDSYAWTEATKYRFFHIADEFL